MANRRDSVRVGDSIQLRTTTKSGEETFSVGASLSESGMFVEYILPYAEGTRLTVSFDLPGQGMVSTGAMVVSAQSFLASDVSNRTGNGLQFESLAGPDLERVRGFIADHLS